MHNMVSMKGYIVGIDWATSMRAPSNKVDVFLMTKCIEKRSRIEDECN